MRWLVVAMLVVLLLAGCADKKKDDSSDGSDGTASGSGTGGAGSSSKSGTAAPGSSSKSGTAAPGGNLPPTATLNASLTAGSAPLRVDFTLGGADPEGKPLTWTLSFGDNTTDGNGTKLPANATHLFKSAGSFTARLVVTDAGNLSTSATVNVTVAAGGPLPQDQHFEGSLVGGPFIPLAGGTPNEFVDQARATHTFTQTGSASTATITLAYEEGLAFTDIDFFVTDPSGDQLSSEASGPEPPMVIQVPESGDWSIEVFAYGGEGPVDYTLDVTYA